MLRFALMQVARFVLLMLAVSLVTFALVGLSPVDPAQANVGQAALASMSDAKRAQLAAYWGTNLPFHERYLGWLGAALQGDLGISLRFNAPVADVIAVRAGNTLALMTVAWVAGGLLGFALGVAAGVRRGGKLDAAVKGYCYLMASTPVFWLALILLMVFSVQLGWFPLGFSAPIGAAADQVTFADALRHLALPAITLSITGVANIALHTREKTIDVMESDYVKFARTRGMTTGAIVRRHGLRNLAMPAITLQFASISEIFGGSVLVEQVFSYPGLGQAAVTAGLGGDAALLAAIAVLSAALVFGGNLVANILYGVVDPRIGADGRQRGRGGDSEASGAPGDAGGEGGGPRGAAPALLCLEDGEGFASPGRRGEAGVSFPEAGGFASPVRCDRPDAESSQKCPDGHFCDATASDVSHLLPPGSAGWDLSDAVASQKRPKGGFGTIPRRARHTRPARKNQRSNTFPKRQLPRKKQCCTSPFLKATPKPAVQPERAGRDTSTAATSDAQPGFGSVGWGTSAAQPGFGNVGWDTSDAGPGFGRAGWDTSDAQPGFGNVGWDTSDAGLSQGCPPGRTWDTSASGLSHPVRSANHPSPSHPATLTHPSPWAPPHKGGALQ